MERNEKSLEIMYGKEDLAECPIFQGGFINFGYWRRLPPEENLITPKARIDASVALYEFVLTKLEIAAEDRILEVGSGRGHGCALVYKKYHPDVICGVDASPDQVERAKKIHSILVNENAISFHEGLAEKLPFEDHTITKVYSVEAVQHFRAVEDFSREAFRVLCNEGSVCLTTFFCHKPDDIAILRPLLPTIDQKIDQIVPLERMLSALRAAGFVGVDAESIGANVWRGFDRWIKQSDYRDGWGLNWYKAYQIGALDYYVIQAKKPANLPY